MIPEFRCHTLTPEQIEIEADCQINEANLFIGQGGGATGGMPTKEKVIAILTGLANAHHSSQATTDTEKQGLEVFKKNSSAAATNVILGKGAMGIVTKAIRDKEEAVFASIAREEATNHVLPLRLQGNEHN